jgi:hypothetical protein
VKPHLNVSVLWVGRETRDELIARSVQDKTWVVEQITEVRGDTVRTFHVSARTETREGARDLGKALERAFPDLEPDSKELTRVLAPYEIHQAATSLMEPVDDPFPPETSTPSRSRHGRTVNWLKDVLVLLVLSGTAGMAFGALALGLIT